MADANSQSFAPDTAHDDTIREKALHAFEASRDSARAAAHVTADTLSSNALGVIVGGVALGAVVSALIPRVQHERDLLAPVGKRLSTAATAAFTAARETGQRELEARGFTRDGAREQAKNLFQNFVEALSQAGTAAAQAAKEKGAGA